MKTSVKEIEVSIERPTHASWIAVVRNGIVTRMDKIGKTCKDTEGIKAYMTFCKEVLESIKETSKGR